jgi:hypothetical protein
VERVILIAGKALVGPCAAIVDRLTFKGTIIKTGTDSYRLTHTKNQQHAEA